MTSLSRICYIMLARGDTGVHEVATKSQLKLMLNLIGNVIVP